MEKDYGKTNEEKQLTMAEVQQKSFLVLEKIKEICSKQGLRYFLTYGTLLGAIRHNGFIPWDDDIDIMMPREDYEKLIQYFRENAISLRPLELIHYSVNKKYIYPITRISDSRYKTIYHGAKEYGLGLFVDIYPLDGIDENDSGYFKKLRRNIKLIVHAGSSVFLKSKHKLKNIAKIVLTPFIKMQNVNKLVRKQDRFAQKYKYNDCEKVCCTVWEIKEVYPKEYFNNVILHKFENSEFYVPEKYHEMLTQIYGDYMKLPPEEDRVGHHFYTAYYK